jgi:serine/threonine protein kinase
MDQHLLTSVDALFTVDDYDQIIVGARFIASPYGLVKEAAAATPYYDDPSPYTAALPSPDLSSSARAEHCGWQVDAEKFLWDERAQDEVSCNVRRDLGHGSIGVVEEVGIGQCQETMARKSVSIRRVTKIERRQAIFKLGQIKNEIDIMKRLSHPHIVKILGCYQERIRENLLVRTLMYPVGDNNLSTFLRDEFEKMSDARQRIFRVWIARWFVCLASALVYMHSKGVHHDDIKPGNIIRFDTQILFTDFSSARNVKPEDTTSTETWALATRKYAAPEAMRDRVKGIQLRHGSQSDVFSLGLVFAEMLTVYIGKDFEGANGLNMHVFGNQDGKGEYQLKVHKIRSWFRGTAGHNMFENLLHAMLRKKRKTRLTARELLDIICGGWPTEVQPSCECVDFTNEALRATSETSAEPDPEPLQLLSHPWRPTDSEPTKHPSQFSKRTYRATPLQPSASHTSSDSQSSSKRKFYDPPTKKLQNARQKDKTFIPPSASTSSPQTSQRQTRSTTRSLKRQKTSSSTLY